MGYSRRPKSIAVALALAGAATSQLAAPTTQSFEVDVVFPRNNTYKTTEIIPIVLAVQNLPTWARNYSITEWLWDIMPWSRGSVPGGITYDMGSFQILNDASNPNLTFLVSVTNYTQWYRNTAPKQPGDKYMLQWSAVWGYCASIRWDDAVMFDVMTEETARSDQVQETDVDILQAPECPQFGRVVQVSYNASARPCPLGFQVGNGQGNPCAIQFNGAIASSVSSRVASMSSSMAALPALATPSTTTAFPTSTSKGGVAAARTMQTGLAAACVLGGLAFS